MMHRRLAAAALFGGLSLVVGTFAHAAEPVVTPGAVLAGPCTTCHGTEGKSPGPVPSLHGRPAEALLQMMLAFRNDTMPATVMNRIAKGYTDEQLELLANHFGEVD